LLKGNLYFTFAIRVSAASLPIIPLITPIAVCIACESVKVPARIKWPNDIWAQGKKLCGMLLDSSNDGDSFLVNIGIGVNVNEDMSKNELRDEATSLRDLKGEEVEREGFLAAFCNNFETLLELSFAKALELYTKYDMVLNQVVTVMPKKKEDPTAYYQAEAIGISKDGHLLVQKQGETDVIELVAEEVTIRPSTKKK